MTGSCWQQGGAQIDQYGNFNTTVIGDWEHPKVRLPGSGSGADIASLCEKNIILMKQNRRNFVKKLDSLTSPGYLNGPGEREKAGLPRNSGPYRVITQIDIYGFDEETKKMKLLQLFEGYTVEDAQAQSSFTIEISENLTYVESPTQTELETLHALDPDGIVLL